eukprot:CAMPEP_0170833002 /NCGR_PEP_ID=MMETSP0734-20130129/77_1 /TAXON_ID=186038 /ORGANISM="Fragilariopsis kerguelensis, Strain L26-C5" /LENGTH=89 /DNA_ID=CAMNT_0011199245 /DNA_START=1159 /DNA_END=1429 /DNA_ORIENTATION=-
MKRSSACKVVGFNTKPIPMNDHVITTMNKQAKEETNSIEFATSVNEYKDRDNDSDSNFENDDKSNETSDDSTIDGDGDLTDGPNQMEED